MEYLQACRCSLLQGCHTCDSDGRDCKKESEPGRGVEGADFVLYITSLTTPQVPCTNSGLQIVL